MESNTQNKSADHPKLRHQCQRVLIRLNKEIIICSSNMISRSYMILSPTERCLSHMLNKRIKKTIIKGDQMLGVGYNNNNTLLGYAKLNHQLSSGNFLDRVVHYGTMINNEQSYTGIIQINLYMQAISVQQTFNYSGRIFQGKFQGYGILIQLMDNQKCVYKGNFYQGLYCGNGTLQYNNQTRAGSWSNNLLQGQGTEIDDGVIHVGNYFNNTQSGYGILYDSNFPQMIVKGFYPSNKPCTGLSKTENMWSCGDLMSSVLHGQGTLYHTDDQSFGIGTFQQGQSYGYIIWIYQLVVNKEYEISRFQGHCFNQKYIQALYIKLLYDEPDGTRPSSKLQLSINCGDQLAAQKGTGARFVQVFDGQFQNQTFAYRSLFQITIQSNKWKNTINLLRAANFIENYELKYFYTGQFIEDVISGLGCILRRRSSFEGQFINEKEHGFGKYSQIHMEKRQLQGIYIIQLNMSQTEGEFIENQAFNNSQGRMEIYKVSESQYNQPIYQSTIFQENDPYIIQLRKNILLDSAQCAQMLNQGGQIEVMGRSQQDQKYKYIMKDAMEFFKQGFKELNIDQYTYSNHLATYRGEQKNGIFHGKGHLIGQDYDYDGQFNEGKFHGNGVYHDLYGKTYSGSWSNGFKHGYGVFSVKDEFTYEGYFQMNKFHGRGKIRYQDGKRAFGYWSNNQLIQTFFIQNQYHSFLGEPFLYQLKAIGTLLQENLINSGQFQINQDGELVVRVLLLGNEWYEYPEVQKRIQNFSFINNNQVPLQKHLVEPQIDESKSIQTMITFDDGSHYKGNWDSQGTYTWFATGKSYTRQLFEGRITAPIPQMIQESVIDSIFGQQIEIKLQYQYIGTWHDGKFNGKGKLFTKGLSYEGEFKDHLMHGKGRMVLKEQEIVGQWNNGKIMGDVCHFFESNIIDSSSDIWISAKLTD